MNGNEKKPAEILAAGWQFYANPTEMEPPGTIFRIDENKKRYIVGRLNVRIDEGDEVPGKALKIVRTNFGIMARIIGLFKLGGNREVTETLEFEMKAPLKKEQTSDVDISKALAKFNSDQQLEFYRRNRYFVIRETRKASGIHYHLSTKQMNEIKAGGSPMEGLSIEGHAELAGAGRYVIRKDFDKLMRVMYLPEEIKFSARSLAGATPQVTTAPVKDVLYWEE